MLFQAFKPIFESTIYPNLTTIWYSRALATHNIPQTAKHNHLLKANISFWTFFDRNCHVSANHRKDKLQSAEIIIRNVNNIADKSRTADQWLTLWLFFISILRICHLWPHMTFHSKDTFSAAYYDVYWWMQSWYSSFVRVSSWDRLVNTKLRILIIDVFMHFSTNYSQSEGILTQQTFYFMKWQCLRSRLTGEIMLLCHFTRPKPGEIETHMAFTQC